nr:hypothetical protein [Tanacetum cinerariifolium]
MSLDNAQSAVTYTSISFDSNGPSWGIPFMNANEFLGMNPYEEVAQQGQIHPLSPAYVSDPIELDEHVPENPSEEHEPKDDDEDLEEDLNKEHEPEDEESDETKSFEEDETELIDAFAAGSSLFLLPPTSAAYDQAPLGHKAAMIPKSFAAARAPRSQYDFVDNIEAGQGLIRSPGHDTRTIARVADNVEDVSYVRALQASDRRMMTSIEEVNLRGTVGTTGDTRDSLIRMEWQRQSAEDLAVTQIMRIHALEARARTDTVEDAISSWTNNAMTPKSIQAMIDLAIQRNSTHTQDDSSQCSGGGLRRPVKPARVCSYIDFMKCQPLNFKGTEGVVGLSQWLEKMELVFYISGCAIDNQVKFATCTLLELALMCTKFLADETEKVDKYISGLPDNIHGNVMSARPKTLDETIELANDLMDQKLCIYAERHNENKRKADDS